MGLLPVYCLDRPDPYTIITAIYYLLFGGLGLLVNNSFLNDVNTYIFLTGIGTIIEASGGPFQLSYIPLTIATGTIAYKLLAEVIKWWSGESIDESDMVMGISGEKFYRLPVSVASLIIGIYICLTLFYFNIYITISLIGTTQIILLLSTVYLFRRGAEHYRITRLIMLKTTIAIILGCIGLGTITVCPGNNWLWIRAFIGYPIANLCLSYALYTSGQLILLLRGKNLSRRTAIQGNDLIFITYYVGRFLSKHKVKESV